MYSRYFDPQIGQHHMQLRVDKHHTIQDLPTSVLAQGVAKVFWHNRREMDAKSIFPIGVEEGGREESLLPLFEKVAAENIHLKRFQPSHICTYFSGPKIKKTQA